jgi:diphthine synthase
MFHQNLVINLYKIFFFMLFIVGLGLADEKDITIKGLEAIQSSNRIYLEAYTSILLVNKDKLEAFYGKPLIIADREMVEQQSDEILKNADSENVSFLVVGDPYGATTHSDLILRAHEKGIKTKSIHNASIMNAIGCCGLSLYNYGQTVSVCFFTDKWRPSSFYDKIKQNSLMGLHTLCLLDIKVKEQSEENMARGKLIFEPPRFMTINQCIRQLLEIEESRNDKICTKDTLAVGLARVGSDEQKIVCGTMEELSEIDFGSPLHSLIIVGKMHFLECDLLMEFAINKTTFKEFARVE